MRLVAYPGHILFMQVAKCTRREEEMMWFEREWPPRLIHLNVCLPAVGYLGRIERCGLVGVGVLLVVGLGVSKAHTIPYPVSLLACYLRVKM